MRNATVASVIAGWGLLLAALPAQAQDWPQWRGANRDARATSFKAPKTWPKDLKQGWKVTVGDGVATPSLVGDRLYVFTRQQGKEIVRCLKASDGSEVWKDEYETAGVGGGARDFQGPRCSPTVADGKVVTLGVHGILSCYDLDGKKLWRKNDVRGEPVFATSSSPVVVNGLCVAQLGGDRDGVIVAYGLDKGDKKWEWSGDGTSYASPVLMTQGDSRMVVAQTTRNMVALDAAKGTLLWKASFPSAMRQYNSVTPIVDGETVIYGGTNRPTRAVKLEKKGDEFTEKELWKNSDHNIKFNTPVVKDGYLYGLSERNNLFCIDMKTGKSAWSTSMGGGGGGGGGFGRQGGYGSVVDAGSVMMALTPAGELVVFEPNPKEFKQLGKHRVGRNTHAYPVPSGNRIFVKDNDSLTLYTVE